MFFILFLKIIYLNENISELNNSANNIIQKEKNNLKHNSLLEFKRDTLSMLNNIFNINHNKKFEYMKILNLYYRQIIHHLLFLYYYFTVKKYYVLQLQLVHFIRYILPLYEKNIDKKFLTNESTEKDKVFKRMKYNNYEEFISASKYHFEIINRNNYNMKNDVFIFSILRKSMTIIFNLNEQVLYKEVLKTIIDLIENIIDEKEVKNYYLTVFFLDLLYIIKMEDQKKKEKYFFYYEILSIFNRDI